MRESARQPERDPLRLRLTAGKQAPRADPRHRWDAGPLASSRCPTRHRDTQPREGRTGCLTSRHPGATRETDRMEGPVGPASPTVPARKHLGRPHGPPRATPGHQGPPPTSRG